MITLLRLTRAAAIVAAVSALGACAAGARSERMVVTSAISPVAQGQPGYQAFRLGPVTGGGATNPLWASNVGPEQFKVALEASLRAAGHLAEQPGAASYEVSAQLTDLDRPMAGVDMSVTTTVRYKAQSVSGGSPLFDNNVAATGTAKFGEHLIGTERLRKANEASVRANIESFIQRLRESLAKAEAQKPIS